MDACSAPLLTRELDDIIGLRRKSSSLKAVNTEEISVAEFLGEVESLAAALPPASFALNLCDNRYTFMLAFCALIVRGQTNLLPPNKAQSTQSRLLTDYEDSYIIHDGVEVLDKAPVLDLRKISQKSQPARSVPQIDLDFLAAITFTSGSTGNSKAHQKPWRTFVTSTAINADYMLDDGGELAYQLATVPGQHMWGMETSILLPLMRRVCVADSRPLFPADIQQELEAMGKKKILVTTPVHLRAMVLSGLAFPKLSRILCATAPLSRELAQAAEKTFSAPLQEIYGCSEVGSMAYRRTARTDEWHIFHDIHIDAVDSAYRASARHLPEDIVLHDHLQKIGSTKFRLLGRDDDMVEIGGKRGSLQELNDILLKTPGILDGVVVASQTDKMVRRLTAIVVIEKGVSKDRVAEQFRAHVDPVFVPRPVYTVEELPREQNGKLPRKNIEALLKKLKS